jgi:hypothetical protein
MKSIPSILLLASCTLLLTAGAGAQQPQEKYTIVDTAAEGDVYAFESGWQVEVDTQSSLNDEPSHSDHLIRSSRTRYAGRVLGTDGPLPFALRRYYAIARSYSRLPGGADRVATSSLQGKTITLRRIGEKIAVTPNRGRLNPRDRTRLVRELADPRDPVIPDREVAIGESWTVDPEGVGRYFPGASHADMRVTLREVKPLAGRLCALLHLTVGLESKFGGLPMKAQLEGDLTYALDLRRSLSLTLRGPVTVDWEKEAAGRRIHVKGEGTALVEQRYEWRKLAGAPVPPAAQPDATTSVPAPGGSSRRG